MAFAEDGAGRAFPPPPPPSPNPTRIISDGGHTSANMYNPGLFVLFLMDCEIMITILQLLEENNLSTYFLPHQFARGSENEMMKNKNLTEHIPTELSASFEDCCWT